MFALVQAFGVGAEEARRMAWEPPGHFPEPRGAIFERVRRCGSGTDATESCE